MFNLTISSEMAQTELHSVKLFLSTILRLAHRSPFVDISSGMSDLLLQLEVLLIYLSVVCLLSVT